MSAPDSERMSAIIRAAAFDRIPHEDASWLLARVQSLILMEEVDYAFYRGRVLDLEASLKQIHAALLHHRSGWMTPLIYQIEKQITLK